MLFTGAPMQFPCHGTTFFLKKKLKLLYGATDALWRCLPCQAPGFQNHGGSLTCMLDWLRNGLHIWVRYLLTPWWPACQPIPCPLTFSSRGGIRTIGQLEMCSMCQVDWLNFSRSNMHASVETTSQVREILVESSRACCHNAGTYSKLDY